MKRFDSVAKHGSWYCQQGTQTQQSSHPQPTAFGKVQWAVTSTLASRPGEKATSGETPKNR